MRLLMILLCALLLGGCSGKEELPAPDATIPPNTVASEIIPVTEPADIIQDTLDQMSIEQRVGQLFLARCNEETAIEDIQNYHLGGFVLFAADFEEETPDSIRQKLSGYQFTSKIPMLFAVDEEGGTVTRVSRYPSFRASSFASPRDLYTHGGMEWVISMEEEKAQLLTRLGLNVNLAPVCDITTDPASFMYDRSFGQEPEITAQFISQTVTTMQKYRLGSALKHFPGYGDNVDTHTAIAVDNRPLEELAGRDLIPFRAGIDAGCGAILVSHTIVECLDADYPASLSPAVHQYLRNEMAFDGVILTDDLVMQAITSLYGAGEAAVLAVLAGNDLLCSTDYATQYEAVLTAVLNGRIEFDILNNAVRNVLQWKQKLGLLD